jgi:hypothetical protein
MLSPRSPGRKPAPRQVRSRVMDSVFVLGPILVNRGSTRRTRPTFVAGVTEAPNPCVAEPHRLRLETNPGAPQPCLNSSRPLPAKLVACEKVACELNRTTRPIGEARRLPTPHPPSPQRGSNWQQSFIRPNGRQLLHESSLLNPLGPGPNIHCPRLFNCSDPVRVQAD